MRLPSVAAAIALVVLVACERSTPSARRPTNSASSTSPNAGAVELSFPGGGDILFRPSRGPGYISHGIGVVRSDGLVRRFAAGLWTFPYWDPATPGQILTLSFESKPRARSFRIEDGQLRSIGAWRTSERTFTFPSPDGRTIAYTPFGPERLRIGILRLVDRATGSSRTIQSDDLVPEGWTPDGMLLAAPWFGGESVLWDPETGSTTPFGQRRLGSIVWAPDGDQFAVAISRGGERPYGVLLIGAPDGRIVRRLSGGRHFIQTPTWSPDGDRVAFIVRDGLGRAGARKAALHVYDLRLRTDVAVRPVSDAFWASWSPDGRWLLIEDWTRDRWLFVAADGRERIPYPYLGNSPRWCCPSSPPVSVQIPVS